MPYIIQNQGNPYERVCDLRIGVNTVGRGLDNSIVVEDDARSLSRHHAEIQVTEKGVFLTDLNSSNGTLVNQTKIVQQKLNNRDLVQFGSVVFQFFDENKPVLANLEANAVEGVTSPSAGLSIVMRVSPEKSRVNMQELLRQQQLATGSVLMIQGNVDTLSAEATEIPE
jgi:pSer/pThr/pTyr-binding forkhead associated (FHA) protein